jgi:hypothetical protein
MRWAIIVAVVTLASTFQTARGAEITVGPGKGCAAIADALAKAQAGDTIAVYPQADNKPYAKVAIIVRKERITFKAVPAAGSAASSTTRPGPEAGSPPGGQRVALSGTGFDYSGEGRIPRAMFQFDPEASGCVLEGFELSDAHNGSHNGAGVRINQANNVTIRDCEIHGCDMGIMSNGNGTPKTAVNQRIESCLIHHNGSEKEPGQNHNLYLGGTSVTLSACEVHSSITGHNVKSRAHFTRVEYCYIHDSANRELDLVDGKGDTTVPGSDAVLLGNIIVKDPKCKGNHAVIHFGQDVGNEHVGTIYLVHNTIVTPFISPVVDLSSSKGRASFINNIIWDDGSGQKGQVLVTVHKWVDEPGPVSGCDNWIGAGLDSGLVRFMGTVAKAGQAPPFVDAAKRDFHLKAVDASITGAGLPWSKITLPPTPGAEQAETPPPLDQYKAPLSTEKRPAFNADAKGDLGAFAMARK